MTSANLTGQENVYLQRMRFDKKSVQVSVVILWRHVGQPVCTCVFSGLPAPKAQRARVQGPPFCAMGLHHPQCPNIYCPASPG